MIDSRFDRALRLERKLQLMLGSGKDWLMVYRQWLDENGIPAEEDGYPTTQAHDDHNINLFVKRQREEKDVEWLKEECSKKLMDELRDPRPIDFNGKRVVK